jgi:calcium-dependent protein kinase
MFDFPGYKYVKTLQQQTKTTRNIVILCECEKQNILVAIKLIELTRSKGVYRVYPLDNEVEILKKIPLHDNIVKFISSFCTDEYLAIVIEYVPDSQDLFDFITEHQPRVKTSEAVDIMGQLICAISHLHFHGICHGDIKPENILIETKSNKIKLLDFEFSLCEKYSSHISGSSHYLSPEKCRCLRNFDNYAADIWSLGVTFYVILTGTLPFYGKNNYETLELVKIGKYTESKNPLLQDFLSCMLQVDPAKRSSAEQLKKHIIWKNFDISF